jgi:DNA-binding CsgD family transcriptional regulator
MPSSVSETDMRVQGRITAAIAASTALDTVLAQVLRAAARLCHAPMAMITLLSPERTELEIVGVFGTRAPVVGARLPVAASLNGLVINTNQSVRSTNVRRDPRAVVHYVPQLTGAKGVLFVPLRGQNGPFGTLGVAKRVAWRFSRRDETQLGQLADSASIAIQNAQLRSQLQRLPPPSQPRKADDGDSAAAAPVAPEPPAYHVSPREREILDLVMAGKSCKEVALTLHISDRTVQHYVERLKLRFRQPRLPALISYVLKHDIGGAGPRAKLP